MEEVTHESWVHMHDRVIAAVVMLQLTTPWDVAPGEALASSQYKVIPTYVSRAIAACSASLLFHF